MRPIRVDDAKGFMRLVGSSTLSVEFHREKIAALEELAGKGEAVLIVIVRKSDGVEYKCLPTGIMFGQPRVCQMCRTELVKLQKVL